jgi:hypothetical protein
MCKIFHVESARNPTIPSRFHVEFAWIQVEFGRILAEFHSAWIRVNLVGMVGIWWEFGGNYSQSR